MAFPTTHSLHLSTIQVSGCIDGINAPYLEQALSQAAGARQGNLVVDCGALEYTSSAGLRVLLGGVRHTRGLGGDLRLANVSPGVRKLLDLAGFGGILKIFPDVASAQASFSARAPRP